MSIDVGGTFTDLVADFGGGALRLFKAPTTYPDPLGGIEDALRRAAAGAGMDLAAMLGRTEVLFHSTTRAINAVVTGRTARTAFLATEGHPDSLVIREGGRTDPFNYRIAYPEPYVPRSLTFEIPGRIWADGREVNPLDEAEVVRVIGRLREAKVEAVAVALIWSIVNPAHELRVGELIEAHLPGVPFTLSHKLNPTVREYRRASSAAIDASLKPVMTTYLEGLEARLRALGLAGEIFAVTSQGGLVELARLAERPILALNSGPSMAPVAGAFYAAVEDAGLAIVTDAGGTTYDVSLVRDGVIPWTRETWLGPLYQGHMTGFPSVDVKSIGAGGGSIASVDQAGLLRVGPESAGSTPGPVCYGRGGTEPTVTDAALVLGHIDPAFFLGGVMALAERAAREAIETRIARPLGLGTEAAAAAILDLATEQMVGAIEAITVRQGIDPKDAVLIAGGGAAGLNTVAIARRLGCSTVIVPDVGAVLSAAGAMMSDMTFEFARTEMMRSDQPDLARARSAIAALAADAEEFFARAGAAAAERRVDWSFEGRYPAQVWEIEAPLPAGAFDGESPGPDLVRAFHARHEELFSFRDDGDVVEIMTLRARAQCRGAPPAHPGVGAGPGDGPPPETRSMTFGSLGAVAAPAWRLEAMPADAPVSGPAVIESSFTTVVIPPGAVARRCSDGHLVIAVNG
ncbi:MAG: hydantoinase/oxoprolinase family protein [Pikeienuella sp.]|uniref:hydantoinase/oxoprolinase family protein n=1 Tax=Pikeienuella sp. TaxID=2831957 RepID=UPI00391B99EE